MRHPSNVPVHLVDYRPADFLVDAVDLDFSLDRTATKVVARLSLRRNPAGAPGAPLSLDGDGLSLLGVKLDGRILGPQDYTASPDELLIPGVPEAPFALEIETASIRPPTPSSPASIAPARLIARNARPRASAASPISSTGPTC